LNFFQKTIDNFSGIGIVISVGNETNKNDNKNKSMKTNKTQQVITDRQIIDALSAMSRDELRAVALNLNVARGKNKNDTIDNLVAAFRSGVGRFTLQFTIRETGIPGAYPPAMFSRKLRTHKPDKTMVPAPAYVPTAPVPA